MVKSQKEHDKIKLCNDCGKYKVYEESIQLCKRCYNKLMKWSEERQRKRREEIIKRKACEYCGKKILNKDKSWKSYVRYGSCKKCYGLYDKWITGLDY